MPELVSSQSCLLNKFIEKYDTCVCFPNRSALSAVILTERKLISFKVVKISLFDLKSRIRRRINIWRQACTSLFNGEFYIVCGTCIVDDVSGWCLLRSTFALTNTLTFNLSCYKRQEMNYVLMRALTHDQANYWIHKAVKICHNMSERIGQNNSYANPFVCKKIVHR